MLSFFSQLSGELEMLKTQLNESARERETLRADKEQERERRKNTEKELRQVKAKDKLLTKGVIEYLVYIHVRLSTSSGCRETDCQY